MVLACGGAGDAGDQPTIDGQPIHPGVVAHVAARDGLDPATARAHVVDTLRLVAAARADPSSASLSDARREHLLRTARARLVLAVDFEATHRLEDVPANDPLVQRARGEQRFAHPALHHVCQLIAEPPGRLEGEALAKHTEDPAWRERAMRRMQDVRRHVEATIPVADAEACDLLLRDVPLEQGNDDAAILLRGEGAGGFDLDACAVAPAADGTCAEPRFAPEWVDAVRTGPVPGLRGPFATRFGIHLALVREILPASMPGDDGFEASVREAVYPVWRSKALGQWMATLRTQHAALVAVGGE